MPLGRLVGAPHAYAAVFTVDTTTDDVDANPGDGLCATSGIKRAPMRWRISPAAA